MSYRYRFFRRGAAGGCTGMFLMLVLLIVSEMTFLLLQAWGILPPMDMVTAAVIGGLFSFMAMVLYYIMSRNLTKQGERRAYARMQPPKEQK